jgi:hypothetical protein
MTSTSLASSAGIGVFSEAEGAGPSDGVLLQENHTNDGRERIIKKSRRFFMTLYFFRALK